MRLAALACHIPERRIDAEAIITSAGGRHADAKVFSKLFGIERVAASEPGQPPGERFGPALQRLARCYPGKPIDTLIYVHGLPTQYVPGWSPVMDLCQSHERLLGSVRFFYEVDQHNCAGLFWALQMARQLLETGLTHAVAIVAGDCLADFPLARRYVPGCTLIGDAFAAVVVDAGRGGVQIGEIALSHRPEFAFGLYGSEAEMRGFNQAHDQMVKDALDTVGFPWDKNDKLLPHNVNKLIWLPFCRRQGIDRDRVQLQLIRDIGHCYTTDPLLLLDNLRTAANLEGEAVTLLSVGLGAYTGACRVHFPRPVSSSDRWGSRPTGEYYGRQLA
jgi:3-oxoacyl-[acyl-carrier-protein] synthase-3